MTTAGTSTKALWLKRLGAASFVFFLVKGLLWLLVPAAIVVWRAMAQS